VVVRDEASAFEDFYRQTYGFARARARRLLGQDDLAREVAQEAYARAWRDWKKVSRFESPLGWVLVATTRLALDQLRTDSTRTRLLEAQHAGAPAPQDPDRHHVVQQLIRRLRAEKPLTQMIVVHCLIEEMTHEETATLLDISRKTVQRHLDEFRRKSDG